MTPSIKLVAFEDRDPNFIYVAIPDERNRYLRTDKSVALVACPQCKSAIGIPCLGAWNKYHGGTHWVRRDLAKRQFMGARPSDVLHQRRVEPEEFWL